MRGKTSFFRPLVTVALVIFWAGVLFSQKSLVVQILAVFGSVTQTTEVDFNAGTYTNTAVSGSGTTANVQFDQETADTLVLKSAVLPSARYYWSCAPNSSTNKIYCFGGLYDSDAIYQYDPYVDSVATMTAVLPTYLDSMSCAQNSSTNKIYCFGGENGSAVKQTSILEYSPATDSLATKVAVLPAARMQISCAEDSSSNIIYCFGGGTPIYAYTPADDTIATKTAVFPDARVGSSCVENSSTHKIYCFGGYNSGSPVGQKYKNTILEYVPATDSISTKTAVLGAALSDLSCSEDAVTHNIYCFGGDPWSKAIYEYDSSQDSLVTQTAVFPEEQYAGSCAGLTATGRIFCLGGYGFNTGELNTVFQYNMTTQYYYTGDFLSSVVDTGESTTFGALDFAITEPANTNVQFQLRSGATSDLSAATWYGPTGTSDYYTVSGTTINSSNNNTRYLQYKAFFTATDPTQTALLSDITVNGAGGAPEPTATPTPTSTPISNSSSTTTSTSSTSNPGPPSCNETKPTSAPWLYAAVPQGSDGVMLYFTNAGNPTDKYVLEYGTFSGKYQYSVANIGGNGARNFLVGSLSAGTTYYFRVRGGNGCATGDWSNELSTTTRGLLSFNNVETTITKLETKTEVSETSDGGENKDGMHKVVVKVVSDDGKPIEGATVILHSQEMKAVTDKEGIVKFEVAEHGDHELVVLEGDYKGVQAINLPDNGVTEFDYTIQVKLEKISWHPYFSVTVGFLLLLVLILAWLLWRTRRRFRSLISH